MEMSFSELRTKEVVNTADGRRLGKVCDLVFCYPENRLIGIVAPGGKGFGFWKNEQFIDMKNIIKIGDDVVLVNFNMPPKPCGRKPIRGGGGGTLRLVLRARAIVIRVLLRGRTVDFLKILPRRPLIRIVAAMRNTNNSHKAASVGI